MAKQKAIQNVELKIISILQGATNKDNRMSIKELTARVYEWDSLRNEDGTLKPIAEADIDDLISKDAATPQQAAHHRYERIRTVRDGIFNILKNYSSGFPIKIHAPLVAYEESENGKRTAQYIDESGVYSDYPIYKDKLIFPSYEELSKRVNNEIKRVELFRLKPLTDAEKDFIEQTIIDNCIDLSVWDIKSKTAFPEMRQWEIYYQQSYTNVEAFVILSSLMNQRNIESSVINDIVRKLIKSTSDNYFEEFVKAINLEASQTTMADEYLSCGTDKQNNSAKLSWDVLHNIKEIMKAIATNKKINFERIYYSCDYQTKQWTIKTPTPAEYARQHDGNKQDYRCTPLNIFLEEGRYWLLAVKDNYNTKNGNFMPCPLDLITNISILDEDGCSLEDIKFLEKYDGAVEKKRLNEYMKTNYERPEEFDIKLRKNQTAGNLVLRTFGNDFTFVESTDEYDVIRVVRSPFGIINWALVNTRDVELIPREDATKRRLLQRIEELQKIYQK